MNILSKELLKPVVNKFDRRSVYTTSIYDIIAMDLVDISNEQNKLSTFLLTIIDIYSRYAWCIPVRDKTAKSVFEAFKSINIQPNNIWVDDGKEFMNKIFKKYCEDERINLYSTFSKFKSVYIERFNRTLREKIARSKIKNNIKINYNLQEIMSEYNNTKHKTIRQKPINVLRGFSLPYIRPPDIGDVPKFEVGDFVRLSRSKGIFTKGYIEKWTYEIFKIKSVDSSYYPNTYEVEDLKGGEVSGIFYNEELLKTTIPNFKVFDKLVGEKTVNRRKQYEISFLEYDKRFNIKVNSEDYDTIKRYGYNDDENIRLL